MDRKEAIARYLQSVGTFLIGLSLIIGVIVAVGAINNGVDGRTIVVTGKAVRQLESNQSVISGSWRETAKTAAAAREAVQEKAAAGIAAVKELGIEDKYIKTIEASVYPEYDYSIYTGKQPEIKDYQGTTTVQVTLTDTAKAESVLAALTKSGTTNTSGPTFGLTTEASDALQKELKVAAVADARLQAEALAKEAGARLGKVITVSGGGLSSSGDVPIAYRGELSLATDAAAPSSDLEVGQNEVSVTVQVTYRLR